MASLIVLSGIFVASMQSLPVVNVPTTTTERETASVTKALTSETVTQQSPSATTQTKTTSESEAITLHTVTKQSSSEGKPEELIPITFAVEALDADQVEISFPIFWQEQRMESVRMERKGFLFEATVSLPRNGLIRYQYFWVGKSWENREQFRAGEEPNRMVHIQGPLQIYDKIYAWESREVERPIRLFGKITDRYTGLPVVDAVIVADGTLTFPTGDGSYEVRIRAGRHQVIVYLLDGSYITESKMIDVDGNTEQNFQLGTAKAVKVKIRVDADPPPYHKIRLYSSAEQTGMRFLYGNGFLTENFVTLENEIDLDLYEDQYVEYLYTVGNPSISFENVNGRHIARHFVATEGLVISDVVGTFRHTNTITLSVKVPDYTDRTEVIGISGLHPTLLYLHPKGNSEWTLDVGGWYDPDSEYRYYKSFPNSGDEDKQRRLGSPLDIVESWKFQDGRVTPSIVSVPDVKHKFDIFVYPLDYYSPSMVTVMNSLIDRTAEKGFHGIVLSQIWGYETLDPPKLSRSKPLTLYMSSFEVTRLTRAAHEKGLQITLFPQLVGAESLLGEGNQRTFDEKWWDAWLREMGEFNMYNARTAQEAGVKYLIFQGRQPGMDMPQSYYERYDSAQKEVMARMRWVFEGKIIAPADWDPEIGYWKDADIVSQKIWDILGVASSTASQEELDLAAETLLDAYKKFYLDSGKPFLIDQLAYSSVDGAAIGIRVPEGDDPLRYPSDLQEQRMIHEAFYKAINEREWIIGANLFGYGFTDAPLDREVGIRAKPAEDIASVWAKKISATYQEPSRQPDIHNSSQTRQPSVPSQAKSGDLDRNLPVTPMTGISAKGSEFLSIANYLFELEAAFRSYSVESYGLGGIRALIYR